MRKVLGLSYFGGFTSLGVATCCVMPMTMMLLGLGGSWLAVFGRIAALGYYVLAASSAILVLAWVVASARGSSGRLRWWLAGSTVLTAVAWALVVSEGRINDYLISLM